MLVALKQSPEAGHLVKEASRYLKGVKGTLVQKKKRDAALANGTLTATGTGIGNGNGNGHGNGNGVAGNGIQSDIAMTGMPGTGFYPSPY